MAAERRTKLLRLSADAFAEARNPFTTDFLVKNDVTADEMFWLSETVAEAIRAWLRVPTEEKAANIAASVLGIRWEPIPK